MAEDQLVVPVHVAALVDAVEEAAVLGPDGTHAQVVVLVGAVIGGPEDAGVGVGRDAGAEGVDGLGGLQIPFHLAELQGGDRQRVGGDAVGRSTHLHTDHGIADRILRRKDVGDHGLFSGLERQAVEVGSGRVGLRSALHQALAVLIGSGSDGHGIVVLLPCFHGYAGQRQIGLDAPHAALAGIGVDLEGSRAVGHRGGTGGAVARRQSRGIRLGKVGRVDRRLGLGAGDFIDLDFVDGDGDARRGGVIRVVGVGGDLAQVQQQLRAALAGGGEVQLQGRNLGADGQVVSAAEGLPFLRVFIAGQQVGVGGHIGLGPDLHAVVRGLQRHAGFDQLDVAVTLAGIGNGEDESALLLLAYGVHALGDVGRPAVAVLAFGGGEIHLLEYGGLAGLAGDGQGGVGLGLQAALVGDGVGKLIGARGIRGSLAVGEGQLRQRCHHNLGGEVAVLGVGGRHAGHGIKFRAHRHALIGNAADLRCGGILGALSAGRQGQDHGQAQQKRP